LVIRQSQSSSAELFAEDPVFLAQVLHHLLLVWIHPSGYGEQQEPEGIQDSGHLPSVGSSRVNRGNQRSFQQIEFPVHTRFRAELRRARHGRWLALHILLLLVLHRSPSEIAAVLLCARSTVYAVARDWQRGRRWPEPSCTM
jgi:hypothetical protein